jgi:hypothetical protein
MEKCCPSTHHPSIPHGAPITAGSLQCYELLFLMVLRKMVIYIEREIEREIENWFSDFQRPAVMRSKSCLDNWSGRGVGLMPFCFGYLHNTGLISDLLFQSLM